MYIPVVYILYFYVVKKVIVHHLRLLPSLALALSPTNTPKPFRPSTREEPSPTIASNSNSLANSQTSLPISRDLDRFYNRALH